DFEGDGLIVLGAVSFVRFGIGDAEAESDGIELCRVGFACPFKILIAFDGLPRDHHLPFKDGNRPAARDKAYLGMMMTSPLIPMRLGAKLIGEGERARAFFLGEKGSFDAETRLITELSEAIGAASRSTYRIVRNRKIDGADASIGAVKLTIAKRLADIASRLRTVDLDGRAIDDGGLTAKGIAKVSRPTIPISGRILIARSGRWKTRGRIIIVVVPFGVDLDIEPITAEGEIAREMPLEPEGYVAPRCGHAHGVDRGHGKTRILPIVSRVEVIVDSEALKIEPRRIKGLKGECAH